ncbi:MAG: hypothetical protein H6635_09405 [Anaerolineales bacterium]|nr:hypothetical protein [Anaerolineales bacterium]MCB9145575.1 hypothetical protein [Anaerolineales bacterium]
MNIDKRKISGYLLIVGMSFLIIGIVTDIKTYTWISIFSILASLIIGGRWLRPRKRK